ncbi:MAG: DUF4907 domain-containing protein [Bacteroidia bacterium]|nr:DUF4907 domain-containing protein [Bacteroidia bacterium]
MKNLIVIALYFGLTSCGNETTPADTHVKGDSTTVHTDTIPKINPYKDATVEVVVFENAAAGGGQKGFGYDIKIDGKTYIHQPNIPAVPGNDGFIEEERARKTGELVAYKVKNNIMPPSVTLEELDSLGVLK